MSIALFQDVGNILFTIGSLPQMYLAYKNRKHLKDLSLTTYIVYTFALVCFEAINAEIGAWIAFTLCAANIVMNAMTMYWIVKSRE